MARKKSEGSARSQQPSRVERKAAEHQKSRNSPTNGSSFDGAVATSSVDLPHQHRRLARHQNNRNSDSYLQPEDGHFINFQNQLALMGLAFRDIPGDGNCLFRALGDQLEGHGRNHFQHRMDTVRYMIQNRKDFEAFVSDEMPYERYLDLLARPGTYAGQDALVAFARLHKVNIVIHQLDTPLWRIEGGGSGCRELHLSYHNGEHYSSVRLREDNSESPANIRLSGTQSGVPGNNKGLGGASGVGSSSSLSLEKPKLRQPHLMAAAFLDSATEDDFDSGAEFSGSRPTVIGSGEENNVPQEPISDDLVQYISDNTGCTDELLIEEVLSANQYNVELAMDHLLGLVCGASTTTNLESEVSNLEDKIPCEKAETKKPITVSEEKGGAKPKVQQKKLTNRERKSVNQRQKLERKEERRQKQRTFDEEQRREEENKVLASNLSLLSL